MHNKNLITNKFCSRETTKGVPVVIWCWSLCHT